MSLELNRDNEKKVELSFIKYFWQASPFSRASQDNIPKFLRKVKVLRNFTDNELRILCKYMHIRSFSAEELIFRQNDTGIGFYFILEGQVKILVEGSETSDGQSSHVLTLDKHDYFGEMALLQEKSIRNASAMSLDGTTVLGFFKPDLEDLINTYPIVATKLLQSVSLIIANRLFSITNEVRRLKTKIIELEDSLAKEQ